LLLALASAFSAPNPAGLMTVFYCLRLETPPTWRARFSYLYPPGTGWPGYTPRHWFPFRRLLQLARLRWRYSNPPPNGVLFSLFSDGLLSSLYSLGRTQQKTPFPSS
jgi:hypothetical protein